MTRKSLMLGFTGLFVAALFSAIYFGYELLRWRQMMDKVRLQLHGAPMTGMPLGFGRFVPLDTRLFWISVAVTALSGTIAALCFFYCGRLSPTESQG